MPVALLEVGEAAEGLAGQETPEPLSPLRDGAGADQRRDDELGRQERAGRRDAPELFEDQRERERVEPEAVLRLRHREAHPAELRHLRVQRPGHAVGLLRRVAHERRRALGGEELARRALQCLLVVGEAEVDHARSSRGIASPRSAMMFFWICDVPPPMMRPSVYMKSSGQAPPSRARRLPRASGP